MSEDRDPRAGAEGDFGHPEFLSVVRFGGHQGKRFDCRTTFWGLRMTCSTRSGLHPLWFSMGSRHDPVKSSPPGISVLEGSRTSRRGEGWSRLPGGPDGCHLRVTARRAASWLLPLVIVGACSARPSTFRRLFFELARLFIAGNA